MRPGTEPKPAEVQALFDKLAFRYDLFNRFISLGMDKSLRNKVLQEIPQGARVLDVGCGTGDLCLGALEKAREVVGLDFSSQMLGVAQRRYEKMGSPKTGRFHLVEMGAEELPLNEEPFDVVVSGFVLRNLYERIDRVLGGIYRSLSEGGRILLLDFTEPPSRLRQALFRAHMNTYGTLFGRMLFGSDFPAGYMAESAKKFPKPPEFCELLRRVGFKDVSAQLFVLGSVVLYRGRKPVS